MIPFYGNKAPRFKITEQPELEQALNLLAESVDSVSGRVPRILSGNGISVGSFDGAVTISSLVNSHQKDFSRFKIISDYLDSGDFIIRIGVGTIAVVNQGVVTPIAPKIKGVYNYNNTDPVFDKDFPLGPYFLATEAFTKTGVYIKINALNGNYDAEVVLHNKSTSEHPNFEAESIYFELGTVEYATTGVEVYQKWESDIFLSSDVKECPFMLSDVTAYGQTNGTPSLTVKVKRTLVYEGVGKQNGRYPTGMGDKWDYEVPLENTHKWYAVYVVMEFDRATKRLKTYDEAIYISFEEEYKENTSTLQYELIGEVNVGPDAKDATVINYKSSVCQEVVPDFDKLVEYCPFFVKDVSERDEDGNVTSVNISIKPEYVEGRLPSGMVWDRDYVLEVQEAVLGRGKFNVYLKMMLDETGTIANYDKALSIELTKYERATGSAIKWYLIAEVFTVGYGSGNDDTPLNVIDYVKNLCPSAFSDLPNDCAFEIEDATDEEGIKTQIRIGQVDWWRYPDGMVEGKPYQIVVPDPAINWYAIYIQVLLNGNGEMLGVYDDESVTISYQTDYQKSTALVEWILIGEITISSREGIDADENGSGGRYISYIQNYCNQASIPKKSGCYFEVLDASDSPDDLAILVRNDTVNWSDRYPDKMTADSTYTIPLDHEESQWFVVYVVMDVDPQTQEIRGGGDSDGYAEGYCYLEVSKEYIEYKKDTKYYFQIAEVNIGYNEDGKAVIDYISNTCLVPSYPIEKKYCPFQVTDRSTYDDGGQSTNCVVKIQCDSVEGNRYPVGMSNNPDCEFNLEITTEDLDAAGMCYIFLRIELDENGKLETYPEALTIQPSSTYLPSGARTKFTLIASVETERGGCIVPNKIVNRCPDSPLSLMESCPFQIEDHSYNGQEVKVLVNNGKIDGAYPVGMGVEGEDNTSIRYVLDLPTDDGTRWYAIYAKIRLNHLGAVDYKALDYIVIAAFDNYQQSSPYFQYSLLGEVSISDDGGEEGGCYISNIINYCYTPQVQASSTCPFECVDATYATYDTTGNVPTGKVPAVVIRNGKMEGRYPQDMEYDTIYYVQTPNKPWNAIYAKFKTDSRGNLLGTEDAVSFVVSAEPLYTDTDATYELIAEVNVDDDGNGADEVTFIKNYCYVPYLKADAYCPFTVTDNSDYNEGGEPTNCVVIVQSDQVDGQWPVGMNGVDDYRLTLDSEDFNENGECYIYVRLEVDIDGNLESYPTAITIQPSKGYLTTGARTQYLLVATVYANDGVIIPNTIVNYCPVPTVESVKTCNFELEDASWGGSVIVLVNNSKVDGGYPKLMSGTGRFTSANCENGNIPADAGWYAFYVVTRLNYWGGIDYDIEDPIVINYFDHYRINTAYYQYDLIGEVTVSDDGGGGFYISHIKNYCPVPTITYSANCPFECVDATDQDHNRAAVVIRNGQIEGQFPSEMTADGFYEVPLAEGFNAIYAVIRIKSDGTFEGENGSVYFEVSENDYITETFEDKVYELIAEVKVEDNKVVFIKNYCYEPFLTDKSSSYNLKDTGCRFRVTDVTNYAQSGYVIHVKVQPDLVQGRFPDNMSLDGDPYTLELDTSQFIYCKLQYKDDDVVLDTNSDAITIFQSKDIMENTVNEEYVLIATVTIVNDVITTIVNNCTAVIPNPCLLSWS